MTQQPFDPMDKLLREALASDATPPADLADRIMERVSHTPQKRAAARRRSPYRRWLVSAVACLAVAAVALPLALTSQRNAADGGDNAAADFAVGAAPDDGAAQSTAPVTDSRDDSASADTDTAEGRKQEASRTDEDDFTVLPKDTQANTNDHPYDPMDDALDKAAEVLEYQGYTLEVLARSEAAIQVTAVDALGSTPDDASVVENAMTAAGFTLKDGWYTLAQEVAP